MKIDRRLFLVIPVTTEAGTEVFVHSAPITSDAYKTYWEVLSFTFAAIANGGFTTVGPKVAHDMLRKAALSMGKWDGPEGVENGLIGEIKRLTNVLAPADKGWQSIPFDDPQAKALIDPEEYAEVEGKLIFFTVFFHLLDRATRKEMLRGAFAPWNGRIQSLDSMAFMSSLATLTKEESTDTSAPR